MRYYGDDKRLSPAYDIVCSRLAIPEEQEESAININGKKNNLNRNDFDELADYLKMPINVRYKNFDNKFNFIKDIIETSKLGRKNKTKFSEIIKERLVRLNLSL